MSKSVKNVGHTAAGPEAGSTKGPSVERRRSVDPGALVSALKSGQFGRIQWDDFARKIFRERSGHRVELDKVEVTRLLTEMAAAGLAYIKRRDLEDAVDLVAHDDLFDSMQEWLCQLPAWDGVSRIPTFLPDYLGTKRTNFTNAVGRYLWTAMVARILYPGCKADMVPVLVSAQGDGKTETLKLLAPRAACWAEARLSDPSVRLLRKTIGRTLLVWEELRGIRGSVDADEVKTFITNDHIDVPRPDGSGFDKLARRFVIFGTSNRYEFLRDPTGHRRYLPFEVGRIDQHALSGDREMLWAEAMNMVLSRTAAGQPAVDYLDAEKLARAEFTKFEKRGEWAECVHLDAWVERQRGNSFSTQDALLQSGVAGVASMAPGAAARQMALSLRQLGCSERRVVVEGAPNRLKRWVRALGGKGVQLSIPRLQLATAARLNGVLSRVRDET